MSIMRQIFRIYLLFIIHFYLDGIYIGDSMDPIEIV